MTKVLLGQVFECKTDNVIHFPDEVPLRSPVGPLLVDSTWRATITQLDADMELLEPGPFPLDSPHNYPDLYNGSANVK